MTDVDLRKLLKSARTIAMVGASADASRDSHRVMRYLLDHGYRILPVNPTVAGGEILGQRVFDRLADIDESIDIVDVFRRPDAVAGIVDEVLALDRRPRALWLQLGVVDEAAAARAREAGLDVVMDRCIKIEHARLAR